MDKLIIDVRDLNEFEAEHIKGSINIPLSQLICSIDGVVNHYKDKKILIMCLSGRRAQIAKDELLKHEPKLDVEVYGGGITKWKEEGLETIKGRTSIPLFRQIFIVLSILLFTFSLLSLLISTSFVYLVILISIGLLVSGLTGFCGLGVLLSKMPWNK